MNKNSYLIIGTAILAVALFMGAFYFYKNNQSSIGPVENNSKSTAESSMLIRDWSPSLGPTMARIVIVEFLDPECEACRGMHPILKKILKKYDGKVRYVLRYMPFHTNSVLAASWLEAAREQGKFWESLDILFDRQPEWAAHHAPRPELIPKLLKTIGVNVDIAEIAKNKPEFSDHIQQDKADGAQLGVTGTPTFFVNGRMLMDLGETSLSNLIEEEILRTSN